MDATERGAGRVVEHADGFYFEELGTGAVFGPYASLDEAEARWLGEDDGERDEIESCALDEAEYALEMSDWIDPDTGLPAEVGHPRIDVG